MFEVEAAAQGDVEAAVDGVLGHALGHDGPARQLGGPGQRSGMEVPVGDDLVDQPDGQRLGGPHPATREDEVLGSCRADQARQSLGAAPAGEDAQQDLRLAEPGPLRGDAKVTGQGELAPAAQGIAVDGGDGGPGHVGQRAQRAEEKPTQPRRVVRAVQLVDVGPGREHTIRAGDHHGARGVVGERLRGETQLLQNGAGQRVHRRVVEAYDGHAVVAPLDVHPRGRSCGHGRTIPPPSQPACVTAAP